LGGGPTLQPDGITLGPLSRFSYTTNGVANPTLHMQPGEVQRWRLLNASDGENLPARFGVERNRKPGLGLNVVAMDAITVPKTYRLAAGDPLVIGPGQRMDVMVKAGAPGIYLLQTLDPNSGRVKASVSPYRDSNFPRGSSVLETVSLIAEFPSPCPGLGATVVCVPAKILVSDYARNHRGLRWTKDMNLPADPLPTQGLPSIATMLSRTPDKVRNVASNSAVVFGLQALCILTELWLVFREIRCDVLGRYPVQSLPMMRDADDVGEPSGTRPCHGSISKKRDCSPDPAIIPRHDRRELRRMDGV
jgi:hypothetical protein